MVRGTYFPENPRSTTTPARTQRGLRQLVAHQPIAIDYAGADGGRAEGAGGIEPGLSTDQGITSLSRCHIQCAVGDEHLWLRCLSDAMLALNCVSIQQRP